MLVLLTQYTITQKTLQRTYNLLERNVTIVYFKLHLKCVVTDYKINIHCMFEFFYCHFVIWLNEFLLICFNV